MPADKKEKLEKVISSIQKRWGTEAISRSSEHLDTEVPAISSGYPELDTVLGIGGIPRGRISELVGAPTSGMTTVALKILAQAQAVDNSAVYIDLERTFDPSYARYCGILLERLVLVHPFDLGQALDMLPDFVHNGGFDLLICDLPAKVQEDEACERKFASVLGRMLAPLSKSNTTLLFLTSLAANKRGSKREVERYPRGTALPHYTTLRLLFQKERWLYRQRDVHGFETNVMVIKNRLSAPGKQVQITILINNVVDGAAL